MKSRSAIKSEGGRSFLVVTATGADLWTAWDDLRRLASLPQVATLGEQHGFRVEDVTELSAHVGADADAQRWLQRRLPAECAITVREADTANTVTLDARFARRGETGYSQRARYDREADGRVRVEAFELHPVEHCNLRCAHCCNLSPFVPPRFQAVESVARDCHEMARFMVADVFKLSGGEPLLHPDIGRILQAVRGSGISKIVRLFTNGLLLPKMPDDFWAALDQLTVSHYASAPLRPEHLVEIRAKAKAFDVVLNIKPVASFYEVVSTTRNTDPARCKHIYQNCWLRHRCMIVRQGMFYMCTRAAYQDVFRAEILEGDVDKGGQTAALDGIRLGGADFPDRLLAYLNREQPLGVCAYCLGSEGPALPHTQLTSADVRAGRLGRKESTEA